MTEEYVAKEQDKTLEEPSEVEISNLHNKEFKVMIMKMSWRRMDEQSEKLEVFNKELENIKKNQREVKNIIIKIKNTLD